MLAAQIAILLKLSKNPALAVSFDSVVACTAGKIVDRVSISVVAGVSLLIITSDSEVGCEVGFVEDTEATARNAVFTFGVTTGNELVGRSVVVGAEDGGNVTGELDVGVCVVFVSSFGDEVVRISLQGLSKPW